MPCFVPGNIFKGCRHCRRPRKGAAAAQGQIEGFSREYCNTLDFCQVGSKGKAGWVLTGAGLVFTGAGGRPRAREVGLAGQGWAGRRGKGLGGGGQGLRFWG